MLRFSYGLVEISGLFAVAQTECQAEFVLTVAIALMYHPEVRFFCSNSGFMGGC